MQCTAKRKQIYKFFFCASIKMQNVSLKELRLIAKNRNINGLKSIPKDKLLRKINNNNNNNNNNNIRRWSYHTMWQQVSRSRI